jgi:hypothetical protein
MKKFGFAGIAGFAATGLAAAILGFAARPRPTDSPRMDPRHPAAGEVPQVDMSVQQSR